MLYYEALRKVVLISAQRGGAGGRKPLDFSDRAKIINSQSISESKGMEKMESRVLRKMPCAIRRSSLP